MTAAAEGRVSQVKSLLARGRGAEVNDKDKGGQTALMRAAANGHTAVVKLLLAKGAEVNEKDHDGQTAWTKAKERGHLDIVSLLGSRRGPALANDAHHAAKAGYNQYLLPQNDLARWDAAIEEYEREQRPEEGTG
jgi:ankyrin repeat protein